MSRLAPAPRGRLIAVAGRRVHLVEAGPKDHGPLIVLEAGSYGFSADWAVVQAKLADRGLRSIAYDRAGLGLSDPGPAPRDGAAIATDLEALLAAIGEPGPYILVGHSMAGLHLQLFAGRNRGRIAGLVLVDAVTAELCADPLIRRGWINYARLAQLVAWLAERGWLRPLRRTGDHIGLTPEAVPTKRWAFADRAHNRAAADEIIVWEATAEQARSVGPLDLGLPIAAVVAGRARGYGRQRRQQLQAAKASPRGHHETVAQARHASLLGVRFADAVVRAVIHVNEAATNSG